VAHDFNNMLGVILGHVELAMGRIEAADPVHRDLDRIRDSAMRSADLTRQLLTFARKQIISPKVMDLNQAVDSTLIMLRRLIGENIHLAWQPGEDLWPVKMDPSQIDQILANLCVNARDAISGVGTITIQTGEKTLDRIYCDHHPGFIPGEYVQLSVSDDGAGMDQETRSWAKARDWDWPRSTASSNRTTGSSMFTVNRAWVLSSGSTCPGILPRTGNPSLKNRTR
jgi:signal transduction histidine kinase